MARTGFGNKSITQFIGLHSDAICNSFADLLLKDHEVVQMIRRSNKDNEDFVPDVLRRWFESLNYKSRK